MKLITSSLEVAVCTRQEPGNVYLVNEESLAIERSLKISSQHGVIVDVTEIVGDNLLDSYLIVATKKNGLEVFELTSLK